MKELKQSVFVGNNNETSREQNGGQRVLHISIFSVDIKTKNNWGWAS